MGASILDQIIGGIADVEDVEPYQLDMSLGEYVSTEAIDELVNHTSSAWRLQFETPNHVVEVTGNDEILIDGTHTRKIN